jgi:hypothetical protein
MLSTDDVERLPLDSIFKQRVMGEVRVGEIEDKGDDEGYRCYRVVGSEKKEDEYR